MHTGEFQKKGMDPLICTKDVCLPSSCNKACSVSTKLATCPSSSVPLMVKLCMYGGRKKDVHLARPLGWRTHTCCIKNGWRTGTLVYDVSGGRWREDGIYAHWRNNWFGSQWRHSSLVQSNHVPWLISIRLSGHGSRRIDHLPSATMAYVSPLH